MSFDFAASCWFLTGPTASGKTATATTLARRIEAEIFSLDSMAVYRGMNIGTAKPTVAEQADIPHHLIDLIEPDAEYSVAQYRTDAARLATEVLSRGKKVLFVGGTPLYLKALLRGIFEGPPADWSFRQACQEVAQQQGPTVLHARLAEVDPRAAQKLHVQDERRVIRALEVYEKTGRPISEWQAQFDHGRPAEQCRVFVLEWPREILNARIDRRVKIMFAEGLVAEVQALLARPLTFSRTAAQAVGYREVLEHLAGQRDLQSTIELVQMRTRQFAKRQGTWFRSLSECQPIPLTEPFDPEATVEKILNG